MNSDSQIAARLLISPAVIHRLVELRRRQHHEVYVLIRSNQLRVAVSVSKNLFEPRVFSSLVNMRDFEEIKQLFKLL